MKDSTGAVTAIVNTAVEFTWTVSIKKFRTDKGYDFTVQYSDGSGSFTKKQVQEHSPPLTGTFTASIGGVSIQIYDSRTNQYVSNIPCNIESSALQKAFRDADVKGVSFDYVRV